MHQQRGLYLFRVNLIKRQTHRINRMLLKHAQHHLLIYKVKMKTVRDMQVHATAQTGILMPVCHGYHRISQISGQQNHR